MKFQPDSISGLTITGYGAGWVAVNGEKIQTHHIVGSGGVLRPWSCANFEDLSRTHFDALEELDPELIVFGTGERIRFPNPAWLQGLYAKRIGVETMDTQAACRTFNFLAGEGRRVVAALLL
jgi:uncharacterized protein